MRGLTGGLDLLRDSLDLRIHRDVEQSVGFDSMLMPASELKAEQQTAEEIEQYQVAEGAVAAVRNGYVGGADNWLLLWFARLRLGERASQPEVEEQLRDYFVHTSQQRTLPMTNALVAVLPEMTKAPLVLFRLTRLAVEIAVAQAFDDQPTADALRRDQLALLPAVGYCQDCQGTVLAPGEKCPACGNPLWKHTWLTVTD